MPEDLVPSTTEPADEPAATPEEKPLPSPDELRAILAKYDRKVLMADPTVSGIAGGLADRQAKKLARERDEQQFAAQAERERRDRLAEIDRTLEMGDTQRAREIIQQDRASDDALQKSHQDYMANLRRTGEALIEEYGLSDDDIAEVRQKQYSGTLDEGFRGFVRDLTKLAREKAAKEPTVNEKQLRESITADVLARVNGTSPTPDVQAGAPLLRRGMPSEAEIMAMDEKTFLDLHHRFIAQLPKGR